MLGYLLMFACCWIPGPSSVGSCVFSRFQLLATWVLAFSLWGASQNASALSPKEEFFEQKIRPLLIDNCQSCHDAQLQESGLRLDSLDGVLQGGLSGPAAIAGDPGASRLIHAVMGTQKMEQMPPDEPLDETEIGLLRRWIKMGLPWTAEDQPTPALGDQDAIGAASLHHWAFQPVTPPSPPAIQADTLSKDIDATAWQQNPIDAFVLGELAAAKLSPNARADRATLLRRLSFDLIGLPPTFEQAQDFAEDPRQDSVVIEEVVDRLLASQQHGERWARYWLDLARYADTRDWQAQAELRYPYAYTYRDYVINSLNADKPYDRFIEEQIAADFYYQQSDAPELAALGFLTVGPKFRNNRLEQIADKIDVVGRGLMGITVSCARCHDHKYDPIPIEDYYSLYGVFASCSTPDSFPTIQGGVSDGDALEDFQKKIAEKQREMDRYRVKLRREAIADLRRRLPTYLDAFVVMGIEKKKEIRGIKSQFKILEIAMTPLNKQLLDRLKRVDDAADPVLGPWHQGLTLTKKQFEGQRARLLKKWQSDSLINPVIAKALADAKPSTQAELVQVYASVFKEVIQQWKNEATKENNTAQIAFADPHREALRRSLMDEGGWLDLDLQTVVNASRLMGKGRKLLGDLEKAITEVEASHPGAPPRAMVIQENEKPVTPFVLLRGEASRRGDRVPRQFVSILSTKPRKPFVEGSGRRELAEAITDPANPLTARVLVNRVWAKYYGVGLALSLDDFGLRSEPPSHPELLDYLASEFVANGRSMKWLHRLIVTSQSYQQTSDRRESAMRADPDNRLLWRQNRRRLDFEAMRDSILSAAGNLNTTVGGKSVRLSDEPYTTRRSIYAYVDRIELDPILRTFDFASPSASAASRPETTIPQQALFGMNHPFVAEQARRITESLQTMDAGEAIQSIYQDVFARAATDQEVKIAKSFLLDSSQSAGSEAGTTWQYGYGPLVKSSEAKPDQILFRPLEHWTGQFYQVSETFPHPKLKFLRLTSTGAHTGTDNNHSVIRRWVAPWDGVVNVNGTLKHGRERSDGVTAVVRCGDVHETFEVCRSEAKTLVKRITVKAGDAIDFIAAPGKTSNADSHTWTVVVNGVQGEIDGQQWRSNTDFASPPPPALSPLAQLAQALLLTNEFLYLD